MSKTHHGGSGGTGSNQHGGKPQHKGSLWHRLKKEERAAHKQYIQNSDPNYKPPHNSDPALELQRLQDLYGLSDTVKSTKQQAHRARQTFRHTVHDTRQQTQRNLQDLGVSQRRGLISVRQARHDTRTGETRGIQDFHLQLQGLVRKYNNLGGVQTQAANQQGVLDAGDVAASASARSSNFALERKPLDIARARLKQDTGRALQREALQAGQVRSDYGRGVTRSLQDQHHDIVLAHQGLHQNLRDLQTALQEAARNQSTADTQLRLEQSFNARQNRGLM